MLGGENSDSEEWHVLENGWPFFGNSSWVFWVSSWVKCSSMLAPTHGWHGPPGHPGRVPPSLKQGSGNTVPDLLLWIEVHIVSSGFGRIWRFHFPVVLWLISFVTWGKSFKFWVWISSDFRVLFSGLNQKMNKKERWATLKVKQLMSLFTTLPWWRSTITPLIPTPSLLSSSKMGMNLKFKYCSCLMPHRIISSYISDSDVWWELVFIKVDVKSQLIKLVREHKLVSLIVWCMQGKGIAECLAQNKSSDNINSNK